MIQNSYLLYRGASLFNGREIAVVLTGLTTPSANRKTGVMIQSWILDTSSIPTEAVKTGTDASICGDCPLRGKTCYVNLVGVNGIWRGLDSLPVVTDSTLGYIRRYSGLGLRLGAYGDPAMVPLDVWKPLIESVRFSLGYTHQWRTCDQEWRNYCQASVESVEDMQEANRMGWSTYRVRMKGDPKQPGETVCINQTDPYIKCSTCQLCSGKKNIVADVHGTAFKINNFKKLHNGTEQNCNAGLQRI